MDFDWSPEEIAFREEVREFIRTEMTDEVAGSIFIDTINSRRIGSLFGKIYDHKI